MLRLLSFWFREIWRGPWDRERRALLFRHYWSYLQFPPLPTLHLPDAERMPRREQVVFCDGYARRIACIQTSDRPSRGVHLTFRPLGKNLRLLGTAIRANTDRNRRTFIAASGPPSEVRDLGARGIEWSPWLWSRGEIEPDHATMLHDDAGAAWATFFRRPGRRPDDSIPEAAPILRLRVSEPPFTRRHLERVLKVATGTSYVFDPVQSITLQVAQQQRRIGWPPSSEQVLGMHVRRGDAAVSQAPAYTTHNSTRTSFTLAEYLEEADLICSKYGIKYIFMATESKDEIAHARAMRPQYTFLSLEHDRSIFPDLASSARFIEDLAFEFPERARPLAISAILDLHCFRACDAFVGSFNSEFSLLAWLLMIGGRRHLIPYISLSHPVKGRPLHPFDALLNLRNNCPLELYHW